MQEHDAELERGGVQKACGPDQPDAVSTQRYSVDPDEPLDVAIVYALAAAKGAEPTEIEQPLHDVVDADALRQLFSSADETLSVTFALDGRSVTVTDGGRDVIVSSI